MTLDEALSEAGIQNFPEPFQVAMAFILPHETDFKKGHWNDYDFVRTENVSGDSGGMTRYGIDASSHRGVNIDALTLGDALQIYYVEWERHGMDKLPGKLAIAAFDVWVNGGYASEWLQRAFNQHRGDEPELTEDGQLGPVSLKALASCDQDAVTRTFLDIRQARYERLAQRPHLAKFLNGWTQRNTDLAALLIA